MQYTRSFEAVLGNNAGGKVSNVNVCFFLDNVENRANVHSWAGTVTLYRNGFPFRQEKTDTGSAIELVDGLVAEVRKNVLSRYAGSNVDPISIVSFLESSKDLFIGSLPIEGLRKKRKR